MKFKKILSVLLALIMVISMMPCQISAATASDLSKPL